MERKRVALRFPRKALNEASESMRSTDKFSGTMRLRHQYLIVGMVWALLLAPLAALSVFAFAAGASWLWIYGDSDWPAGTSVVLPLIGFSAGIIVALVCVRLAGRYGAAREEISVNAPRREQVKVILAGAIPIAMALLVGAKMWIDERHYSQEMALVAQRESHFAALAGNVQKISRISVAAENDGHFLAKVFLDGQAEGKYRLGWKIASASFSGSLLDGLRLVDLEPGNNETEIDISKIILAEGYAKHLSGSGAVLVDEPFRLSVSLQPSLTTAEMQTIPPGEKKRLELGESPLQSQKTVNFPVKFAVDYNGIISE
jgi:hypothetical protein